MATQPHSIAQQPTPAERIRIITAQMRRAMPNACGDWAAEIEQALADMEAAAAGLTAHLRDLCAKHGLASVGAIYHARQDHCCPQVVAYAQAYGECHTAIGETAEDALAAAIVKADAHRLKFEGIAQIASLDAGTMQVAPL
jgi:hypothetical protein